jgi:16S rRNA (uracil1498-N3)-methyltransferase
MSHRFRFIGIRSIVGAGAQWRLLDEEMEHIRKVLKLKIGTQVEVFDGRGKSALGEIVLSNAREVLISEQELLAEEKILPSVKVLLGSLKPADVDELLPDFCELGLNWLGVYWQKGVDHKRLSEGVVSRWNRILISACKQSKRTWLPELVVFDSLRHGIEACEAVHGKYFLDPSGQMLSTLDLSLEVRHSIFVVGGERGLSEEEASLLTLSRYQPISLGRTVLRARTAARTVAALNILL